MENRQETWTDRCFHWRAKKHLKNYPLGKCKLRPWWGVPTHLLAQIKWKIVTAQGAGEDVKKSYIAYGNVNGTSTWENCLAVSSKNKRTLAIWPSNYTPGHLSQENENLYLHTKKYMFIVALFVIAKQGNNQNIPP